MSANNQILIVQTEKNCFLIDEIDADTGKSNTTIGATKTLEEAVKKAKEYEQQLNDDMMTVEYGISIKLLQ